MSHRVTLIPGDGIGPEVIDVARRAVEATGVPIEWDRQNAGLAALEAGGDPLPPNVLQSIRERGVALKGPTFIPAGSGFASVSVGLRRELDLYAGVRPVRTLPGVPGARPDTDLVVVRMNHEDVSAGVELAANVPAMGRLRALVAEAAGVTLPSDAGVTFKFLSASACRRLVRRALAYAGENGRARITAGHKATNQRETDGLFLAAVREVGAEQSDVTVDDLLIDSLCHRLVSRPEEFDMLLLPAFYGDVVSDIAAALVGGLGVAPGANLGDDCAVFEAVHGTAPRLAGLGCANPFAAVLSAAMMLRHLGERESAKRVEDAVATLIGRGAVTYDLTEHRDTGIALSTEEVGAELERQIRHVSPG